MLCFKNLKTIVMSMKKGGKTKKHLQLAKLVTGSENSDPCVFCNRVVDDEIIYGKLYSIGDIQCHYFCVLLSCCLVQKGRDEEGLFGFLYPDIIAEVERSKKHKCSYCGRDGATLGCTVSQCRKQFHLPCGRERNAVSLFYGNFKSFCEKHAPRQRVNNEIMAKAAPRKATSRKQKALKGKANKTTLDVSDSGIENSSCSENILCIDNTLCDGNIVCIEVLEEQKQEEEAVCVICYENVDGYPTLNTFWPPCCARDAWFHRNCLQRMALSAGMHYLKCPLCNQKEPFLEAVMSQGYYVPDRDASWELEQNAFAEIYERPVTCSAPECSCPMGRDYDADMGAWDIRLCVLCGSSGIHAQCSLPVAISDGESGSNGGDDGNTDHCTDRYVGANSRHVCPTCAPVAPDDLEKLVVKTETARVISSGVPQVRGRPMPSRMSLRRTKQRALRHLNASASDGGQVLEKRHEERDSGALGNHQDTEQSRLDTNITEPEPLNYLIEAKLLKNVENKLLSPLKMFEEGLRERLPQGEAIKFEIDPVKLMAQMRERFTKPKPLVEKKKIVNDILENMLTLHKDNVDNTTNKKTKEPLIEWNSPKKGPQVEIAVTEENIAENTQPELKENPVLVLEDNETFVLQDNQPPVEQVVCKSPPTSKVRRGLLELFELSDDASEPVEETTEMAEKKTQESGSSNSTCHLPPVFIADDSSNGSLPHFESPKKKPVHVQDSSMEISHEHSVSIDLVKNSESITPSKSRQEGSRTIFQLNPNGKFNNRLAIDIESFKCHYLNEVDRGYKSNSANNIKKKAERAAKRKYEMKKSDNSIDVKVKRRRKGSESKRDVKVKVRWRSPMKKFMLKYAQSPNETRLVQTTIQSFFGAKHPPI